MVLIRMIVSRLVDLVVDSVVHLKVEQQEVQHNQAQTHFMGQLITEIMAELDQFLHHMLLVEVAVLVVLVPLIHQVVFLVMVVMVEQMYMLMDQEIQ